MSDENATTATATTESTAAETTAATETKATETTTTATTETTAAATETKAAETTAETTDTKGYWPDDWREKMSEGDDKFLETLKRYASPLAFRDAFKEQRKLISSGKLKSALPENATPEQVAAWRSENGIPESPDKYDVTIAEGHVWGEADKPLVDSFAKTAHEANLTPAQLKKTLKWYGDLQSQALEQQQNADAQFKMENDDLLRQEWGTDYRVYVGNGQHKGVVGDFLGDFAGTLEGARDANGRLLSANAAFLRWAVSKQLEANPISPVLPGAGVNSMQSVEAEIDKIKAMMGDPNSDYKKPGPVGEKLQARYRELIDARDRAKGKRAA